MVHFSGPLTLICSPLTLDNIEGIGLSVGKGHGNWKNKDPKTYIIKDIKSYYVAKGVLLCLHPFWGTRILLQGIYLFFLFISKNRTALFIIFLMSRKCAC